MGSIMRIPKSVKEQWTRELEKDGFKDIEDRHGRIRTYDRRTIAFDNRERLLHFFLQLDQLLTLFKGMPTKERKVMKAYSEGLEIKEIVKKAKLPERTIYRIISRYRSLVLAIEQMAVSPQSLEPTEKTGSEDEKRIQHSRAETD